MTGGQVRDAQRRALNILDTWLDATGVIAKGTGYYYELQGVVEDAVHCGAQAACNMHVQLDSEESK